MCSFCFYFADVFSSTMWSDLRAAVPQGSSALQSLASSLPDVALARLWELVLEAFKDIVPDISAIGTHNLRSGGATATANAGVPDRLFKRRGRWAIFSSVGFYGFRYLLVLSFIDSSFCSVGLARGTVSFFVFLLWGTAGPGFFLLGASERTGRFFHPVFLPGPHFIQFSLRPSVAFKKHVKTYSRGDLELFCAKNRWKKHQIFEK